jgi:membrane-associated phospholipid phosphatase
MERKIYDTISLFEFVAVSGFSLFSLANKNLYVLSLVAMLVAKQIPEKLLKKLVFKGSKFNIRPSDAANCDMINKGGDASANPGFPSGHSTVALTMLTIFLFEYIRKYKKFDLSTLPIAVYILIFFAIAVPYVRVKSKCHTLEQVMGGAVLGIAVGVFFSTVIDAQWLIKYPEYKKGKETFYGLFWNQ